MADSQFQTILEAMSTVLKAAIGTSSGATHIIADANFYVRKFPSKRGVSLPAVLIAPTRETNVPATNASYDVGYGVQVSIVQAGNQDLTSNEDRMLYWRETAIDAVADKKLAAVAAVYNMLIEPGAVFDSPTFVDNHDATSFLVRVFVRKTNK